MIRIGLTGGIGSGKTTVAKIFEQLNVPVFYADDAAKDIMNRDETLKAAIKKQFGEEAYKNDQLDRAWLAAKVFNNKEQLDILNALVHPATIGDAENWMKKQTTHYAIKEAALIFESAAHKYLDYVIGVSAPEDLRIKRAMQRSNITAEEVNSRMKKQMNEEEKMKRCDFIITNDEKQMLIPQVLDLHKKLLSITKILILCLVSCTLYLQASAQLIPSAGVNLNSLRYHDKNTSISGDNVGWHAGVYYKKMLNGKFAVQPGLFFSSRGGEIKTVDSMLNTIISNIELCGLLLYEYKSLNIGGGPEFSYAIDGKLKGPNSSRDVFNEEEAFERTLKRFGLGAKLFIAYTIHNKLYLAVHFSQGITSIYKGDGSTPLDVKAQTSVLGISVGYVLR